MTEKQLRDQLDAAWHAMERVRFKMYADAVLQGRLSLDDLPKKMREAMENFDGILRAATAGIYGDVHAKKRAGEHDYIAEFKVLTKWDQFFKREDTVDA